VGLFKEKSGGEKKVLLFLSHSQKVILGGPPLGGIEKKAGWCSTKSTEIGGDI